MKTHGKSLLDTLDELLNRMKRSLLDTKAWESNVSSAVQLHDMMLRLRVWEQDVSATDSLPIIEERSTALATVLKLCINELARILDDLDRSVKEKPEVDEQEFSCLLKRFKSLVFDLTAQVEPVRSFLGNRFARDLLHELQSSHQKDIPQPDINHHKRRALPALQFNNGSRMDGPSGNIQVQRHDDFSCSDSEAVPPQFRKWTDTEVAAAMPQPGTVSSDGQNQISVSSAETHPLKMWTGRQEASTEPSMWTEFPFDPVSIRRELRGCRIPGGPLYLFPLLKPSQTSMEEYEVVQQVFKHAVEKNDILQGRTKDIVYEIRMCGVLGVQPKAYIVILCTWDIKAELERLFDGADVRESLGDRHPSPQRSIFREFFGRPLNGATQHNSNLGLIYLPGDTAVARKAGRVDLYLDTAQNGMSCGLFAVQNGRKATVGAYIRTDGREYGFTVAHLFEPETDSPVHSPQEGKALEKDEKNRTFEEFDCDSGGLSTNSVREAEGSRPNVVGPTPESYEYVASGSRLRGIPLPQDSPSLDWALIDLTHSPNTAGSEVQIHKSKTKATMLPQSGARLATLMSANGKREGILMNCMARIEGRHNQRTCQMWNFHYENSENTLDGDCGAFVVDETTSEVYGHVIGSNAFGEAYIIPIQHTLEQLSLSYGIQNFELAIITHASYNKIKLEPKDPSGPSPRERNSVVTTLDGITKRFSERSSTSDTPNQNYLVDSYKEIISINQANQIIGAIGPQSIVARAKERDTVIAKDEYQDQHSHPMDKQSGKAPAGRDSTDGRPGKAPAIQYSMTGRPGRVPTKQALKEHFKNTLEKPAPMTPSGQLMAINNGLTPADEIARQEKRAPNTSKSRNTQQFKLDDAMPQPERKASNNPESRVFEYNVHQEKGWMVAGGFGAHQKGDIVVSRTVKDNLTEADDREAGFIGGDIIDTKSFVNLFSRTGGNEESNSNEDDRTEGDNEEDKK